MLAAHRGAARDIEVLRDTPRCCAIHRDAARHTETLRKGSRTSLSVSILVARQNSKSRSSAGSQFARPEKLEKLPRSRISLAGLVSAPVPALVIGAVVMYQAGVPTGTWIRNVAATFVGVLVVVAASWRRPPSSSSPSMALNRWLCALGLVLLGATLTRPGVAGVHRWLDLGPLDLHVGAILLPSLLVLLTDLDWAANVLVAFLTLTVLLLQPDAAQAASFAAGWGVWVAMTRGRAATGPIATVLLLAGAAWLRPDPLEPVGHVEGIVGMAATQGAIWGVTSIFALALLPIAFLMSPKRKAGVALAVYMACTLVSARLGTFPVPVLGYGVSPILGYYLAIATLRLGRDGNARN